jgi:hypothetical protein
VERNDGPADARFFPARLLIVETELRAQVTRDGRGVDPDSSPAANTDANVAGHGLYAHFSGLD